MIRTHVPGRSIAAIAVAGLLALGAPAPAAARVVISVEFVFGGVAAGGLGIYVAASGTWSSFAAKRDIPDALLEVRGTRPRFGIPFAPLPALSGDEYGERPAADGLNLNLLRWRF